MRSAVLSRSSIVGDLQRANAVRKWGKRYSSHVAHKSNALDVLPLGARGSGRVRCEVRACSCAFDRLLGTDLVAFLIALH